jgi:hypothetical protein
VIISLRAVPKQMQAIALILRQLNPRLRSSSQWRTSEHGDRPARSGCSNCSGRHARQQYLACSGGCNQKKRQLGIPELTLGANSLAVTANGFGKDVCKSIDVRVELTVSAILIREIAGLSSPKITGTTLRVLRRHDKLRVSDAAVSESTLCIGRSINKSTGTTYAGCFSGQSHRNRRRKSEVFHLSTVLHNKN